jgi:membrane associated rhomboid family serine protease
MFLFIPIRSERSLKRIPYFTIGLIIFNIIIWFFTSSTLKKQMTELKNIQKMMIEIEYKYLEDAIFSNPSLLQELNTEKHYESILAGEIIPLESTDFGMWFRLYEDFLEKKAQNIFEKWGFIPKSFDFTKIFTAMVIHANLFHLIGNMLFLWIVGCNMEDDVGWKEFFLLYIISGIFASLFHKFAFPQSVVPCIGASGAIAGIMGAFMIKYFKTKIKFFYFVLIFLRPLIGTVSIYAYIVLPFWFFQQIFGASWSGESGVAYWAHIGGFVFGAGISFLFKTTGIAEKVEDSDYIEKSKFSADKVIENLNQSIGSPQTKDFDNDLLFLIKTVNKEPMNINAWISLGRAYYDKKNVQDSVHAFNTALQLSLESGYEGIIRQIYSEIKEKNILKKISRENIYNLANDFEKTQKFKDAIQLYGLYVRSFSDGVNRPHAIYRAYLIFRDKLNDPKMASMALSMLKREYPELIKKGN